MPAGRGRNGAERTRYTRLVPALRPATLSVRADVAELVDAHGSGPCGRKLVEVQVLSSALQSSVASSRRASESLPKTGQRRGDPPGRPSSPQAPLPVR